MSKPGGWRAQVNAIARLWDEENNVKGLDPAQRAFGSCDRYNACLSVSRRIAFTPSGLVKLHAYVARICKNVVAK